MNQYNQQGGRSEQPVQGRRPTQRNQSQGGRPTQGSQSQGRQRIEHGRPQGEATQPPGSQQGSAGATPVAEMTVDSPTLRWVSIGHPDSGVELGPDDYVLESVFNPGMDAWEVLVLVHPREDEDGDEEEED